MHKIPQSSNKNLDTRNLSRNPFLPKIKKLSGKNKFNLTLLPPKKARKLVEPREFFSRWDAVKWKEKNIIIRRESTESEKKDRKKFRWVQAARADKYNVTSSLE